MSIWITWFFISDVAHNNIYSSPCDVAVQSGRTVHQYSEQLWAQLPLKYLLQQAHKQQDQYAGLFSPLLRYVNRKRTPPWPLLTASRVRAPWSYNPMVSFHLFLLFYTPIRVILHTHLVAAVNVAVLRRIGISARSPQTSELYRNIDSMILWSDCEHE